MLRCLPAMDKVKGDNDDQNNGIKIAHRALEEPLRQIVKNSGGEPSVVVANVIKGKDNYGFNAARVSMAI